MSTHVLGKNLDEKMFWPVYEKCEAVGLPIDVALGKGMEDFLIADVIAGCELHQSGSKWQTP